jgi:hypothetical protein
MFHYLLEFTKYTILTKSSPGQVYSQIDTSRLVTYYNFRRPSSATIRAAMCIINKYQKKKNYLQHFTLINKLSFPNYYYKKKPTETIFEQKET